MNLEECYAAFGGSYEEIKEHLQGDALIERFLIKFLSDKSYETLKEAVQEENHEGAFRAVHTLKGICLNLCFTKLSSSCCEMTELLRNYEQGVDKEACQSIWEQVSADYAEVVDAIQKLAV